MTIWVRADQTVVQCDPSDPSEPAVVEGCSTIVLSLEQLQLLGAATAQPNSGITFNGERFDVIPVQPPAVAVDPNAASKQAVLVALSANIGQPVSQALHDALVNYLAALP